jgi:hypothetical protein
LFEGIKDSVVRVHEKAVMADFKLSNRDVGYLGQAFIFAKLYKSFVNSLGYFK